MTTSVWFDPVYRARGEFQRIALPKVVAEAAYFLANGVRDVLDLGCGTGRHSLLLGGFGFRVEALDASSEALKILSKKADEAGLTNIRTVQGQMQALPYAESVFDAVVCTWAMGHGLLSDSEQAVAEIYRVLRPGGIVITDFMSTEDSSYGHGEELELNTFVGSVKGEEHIPHHYFQYGELERIFTRFTSVSIRPVEYCCGSSSDRHVIRAYDVRAQK